jgi:tetratricopeptide (TPR) repeat protein
MRTTILALVCGALFMLMPGHTPAFVRPPQHAAARPAPHPVPVHTPAYVAPRPVAPVYHPPVHPVAPAVAVRPVVRAPVVVQPVVRPPAVVHPVVRPPVTVNPVVRPPVGVGRPVVGVGSRSVVVSPHVMVNRGIYIPRGNAYYRPGWAHYQHYYDSWHHGYWGGWYGRPWLWFGAGFGAGWLGASALPVAYADPYWVPPPDGAVYDYSQPIPVPQPVEVPVDPNAGTDANGQPYPPMPPATDDPNAAQAAGILDQARQAFLANDYDNALKLADQAIRTSPKDTTLHEFRALVLFAQQRYQDATATIYAVLAVGPGWDYNTLNSFYRDPQTYTNQLRALEAYTKANPQNAPARFLLAYHYLVLDHRDAAAGMLRSVVALQPNDQLAAYLLQMIQNPNQADRPAPGM